MGHLFYLNYEGGVRAVQIKPFSSKCNTKATTVWHFLVKIFDAVNLWYGRCDFVHFEWLMDKMK